MVRTDRTDVHIASRKRFHLVPGSRRRRRRGEGDNRGNQIAAIEVERQEAEETARIQAGEGDDLLTQGQSETVRQEEGYIL